MITTSLVPAPVSARLQRSRRLGVGFGPRFFLVMLLGALWVVPAFWDARFLLVMAAWDICALTAWAIDLALLPRPDSLLLERTWGGPPSLSNKVEVTLELRNLGRSWVECQIVDDIPKSLRREPPAVNAKARGRSYGSAKYMVRPLERGDIPVGSAWVRYRSAARFAERWAMAGLTQKIRVYPDFEEARYRQRV